MATTPRTFTFTTVFAAAIPEEALKPAFQRDTSNDLPFKGLFDGNLEEVAKGKLATFFVPFSYFIEARNVDAKKVNAAYVKGKLRDQFKAWQDATKKVLEPAVHGPSVERTNSATGVTYMAKGPVITPEKAINEERGFVDLVMMERTGKEKDLPGAKELGITEPGVQFWLKESREHKEAREAAEEAAKANKTKKAA